MGISVDSKCIVKGEEKHLNKLNDFLNSIKDKYNNVEFDRLCDFIPIYDEDLETSNIRADLNQNEIIEMDGEKVLQFWVHGWKGNYLDYIKQLIKDKELGFYDKDDYFRSVLRLYYMSYIECEDYTITNDIGKEVFNYNYILDFSDGNDSLYFNTEDEIIEYIKNEIEDVDVSECESLDEMFEKLEENDYSIEFLKVKTEEDLEQEDDDW